MYRLNGLFARGKLKKMRNYTPQPINRIIDQSETLRKISEMAKIIKLRPFCRLMGVPYPTITQISGKKRKGIAVKTKIMVDIMYEVFQNMKNNAKSKQDVVTVLRRDKHYGKK